MAKIREKIVVAVTWKGVDPGKKGWAVVYDAENLDEAMNWIREHKRNINHAALTHAGDFVTYQEVNLFKGMLKGMLNLEGAVVGNEEEQEWFNNIEMEMSHLFKNELEVL